MKLNKILIPIAFSLFLICAGNSATISYIYQTNNFAVNSGTILKNWQQFDPSLGTLIGINFEASAGLSGSFTVENQNTASNQIRARYSNDKIATSWLGSNSPGDILGTTYQYILTNPDSGSSGTYIKQGVTTTFSINSGQSMVLPLQDLFSYAPYFTGLNLVSSEFSQVFNITVTGGAYRVNSDNVLADGSAVLTYIYQVPEPSSGALLMLGIGGLIALRRVPRKAD